MTKKTPKRWLRRMIQWGIVVSTLLFLPRIITAITATFWVSTTAQVEPQPVAIVFGAGLRRDGRPAAVLRDRVRMAAELYHAGKVSVLLMSGDNSREDYDEPSAMYDYAIELGVPSEAIVRDFAGRSTYETCYRAKEIFGVSQAVLVTQAFHLPRALFTCRVLGIAGAGIPAYESRYWRGGMTFWTIREVPATAAAFWQVFVSRPLPILGAAEPIVALPGE